jgi:hypothetical protein
MTKFIHFTGTANIAAGILLLGFWYLYALLLPYQKLSSTLAILVKDSNWGFVNLLGVLGSIAGLVGLIGIYLYVADDIGTTGLIGFLLAFIGTLLLTIPLVWDTILWPILTSHDASLLDFNGPIYTSKTFVPFFVLAGLVYSSGYIILGIVLVKSGVYPSWSSIFLAVGAPLFGLGAMFGKLQVYPRSIGITLMCIGLIWIGNIIRTP